ncbi:hypothetical protein [Lutimonas sp.]|uniref:hypothetical protein n=1 Tax=Lutimonas sp. TaxID=1872403 RepID=UPI003D9AF575
MKKNSMYLFFTALTLMFVACKSQSLDSSVPFEIVEKSYFYWVGGKQGTEGTTIVLRGKTSSMNISFSKLYFQNNEYDIVPEFNSYGFEIKGNFSRFRDKDMVLHKNPAAEYGNTPAGQEKKIPFDLEDDQAVLLYSVNGLEGYHKVSGIKKMDKVFMP